MFRLAAFALTLLALAGGMEKAKAQPGAAPAPPPALAVLPRPVSVAAGAGSFQLRSGGAIVVAPGDQGARRAAQRLADLLLRTRGLRLAIRTGKRGGAIGFARIPGLPAEGYRLTVTPRGTTIAASDDAGLFYGGITLWQLATAGGENRIPATAIEDAPRFAWRGLMLDSARHFQSPAFIRRLIDWMAASKLNRLHWHLVDDQGWRLQIRKYPRLTAIGAWRVPASAPGAPPLSREGGFYSQAEVRAIVAYAAARHVTIVPEIEMPGHALSAIRAYPRLGMGVPIPPGIESDWGIFPWLYNVDEPTIGFLDDVLDEVMALFPSTYIHVGGDEAVKDQWKADPAVQAKIRALGLKDENALQGWLVKRIEEHLAAHGRRLIGWDEILEGGVAPSAAVMSWRGISGAIAAAQGGHDTVLSPAPILYFDNIQSPGGEGQPGRGSVVSLGDVYAFDPAPATLTVDQQRHILGLQGNLWTEHVRGDARAAFMAFPRALAVAELGWSPATPRDFLDFADRVADQLDRLAKLGLGASTAAFAPIAAESFDTKSGLVTIKLANQIGSEMRYTLDGTMPGATAALYTAPLSFVVPARLRARGFRGGHALPGGFDRIYDPASVRRRGNAELRTCAARLNLALEDDAPAQGRRAVFLTDIVNPCWIYEKAPMDGIASIAVDVGQLPFNFQIGHDRDHIVFTPPRTAEGEMEVRADTCTGEPIAVLPLAPAAHNPGVTTLRATIRPLSGAHDLCFTYTARGPDPLWAVAAVQLEAPR
ncbi:MAG: beta-N-acetylhexosaminidase [Alphaproteobacteria bacterium]|nr:beta-N-acetylhexosaminidase [Alphaproteobacteria bacterium]